MTASLPSLYRRYVNLYSLFLAHLPAGTHTHTHTNIHEHYNVYRRSVYTYINKLLLIIKSDLHAHRPRWFPLPEANGTAIGRATGRARKMAAWKNFVSGAETVLRSVADQPVGWS